MPPNVATPEQWAVVTGFFIPPLMSVIVQSHWSKEFKTIAAFFICVGATFGQLYFENRLNFQQLLPTLINVLVTSIASFHGFWKPLGIQKLEKITDLPTGSEGES